MQNLVIYGTGNFARLAHYYAEQELAINVLGFVVDDEYFSENLFASLPIFKWEKLPHPDQTNIFVAIGYKNMRARALAFAKIKQAGYECVNLISPHCYVAGNVEMGVNNIILPNAVIEPFVSLGNNNVVWSNATICHDVKIGDHNFLASNITIGGNVNIGNKCFFGFNSVVTQNLIVEDEVLLAAGSVALTSLKSLCMYSGLPAILRKNIHKDIGISIK
jgi:sugar O-acyltransferase (sialic acid O-acetyltransferase NeuD family)